jgi:hypothetical protein
VLPQLHSFTGETDICLRLSGQGKQVEKLGLTFLYESCLSETEESPTFDTLTSGTHLSVTTLELHGLDGDMYALEVPQLPYPAPPNFFPALASAFPNVVNLNIELGGRLVSTAISYRRRGLTRFNLDTLFAVHCIYAKARIP